MVFKDEYGNVVEYPVILEYTYEDDWVDRYNAVAPAGYEISTIDTFSDSMFEVLQSVADNNSLGISFWRDMTEARFSKNLNTIINALS